MLGDMQPAWVIIVTVLRRAEVVPPYGWTLPFTIHTGMAGIVTGVRAAGGVGPYAWLSMPCTIHPARVILVTWVTGDS